MILALDLATTTGWAETDMLRIDPERVGLWNLSIRKGHPDGERFGRAWAHIASRNPDAIIYEASINLRNLYAARVAHGLVAIVEAYAYEHRVVTFHVAPNTLKHWATGNGRADKAAMIETARERYGYSGDSDDEADALHLLQFGLLNCPRLRKYVE